MSFERNAAGISSRRSGVGSLGNGTKKFSEGGISGGIRDDGQYLENLINRGGKLYSAMSPVALGNRAKKNYSLENLLYSFGPNSTDGTDVFVCEGGTSQSGTYSGTVLVGKTFSFVSSENDPMLDRVYFQVALSAGTYLLHVDLGADSSGKSVDIGVCDGDTSLSDSIVTAGLSDGEYFADAAFTVSSTKTYRICFTAVYGTESTYSLFVKKLYLFDSGAAIGAGCETETLSSASFSGRYNTVTAWKQIGSGKVSARFSDGGICRFAVGAGVFARDGDEISAINENALMYGAGAFYRYCGGLYLTDGDRILSVGDDGTALQTPYIPVYAKNCSQDGTSFTAGEPLNIYSHYVKVEFAVSSELTRIIPPELFCSGTCTVYRSGTVEMSSSLYSFAVADGVGTLTLNTQTGATLTAVVGLSSEKSDGRISFGGFSSAREAFGTDKAITVKTGSDGLRTVISADGDEVLLMKQYGVAYVGDDYVRLNTGGTISALTPYDGGYFAFATDFVKRVTVGEDGSLSLIPFFGDIGCDAPKSVVKCADKTVFGNSGGGIYYIDRYGISERDVCRRVSLCVSGVLAGISKADIAASEGVFSDEKYYLFAGDTALVWDIYAKAPSSGGSESDEKKLVWYALKTDGMRGIIDAWGGKIYYLGNGGVKCFSLGKAGATCPDSIFSSAVYYPESATEEKLLCGVSVTATLTDAATLCIYCDGEKLPDEYTLSPSEENRLYKIRLPMRKFRGISASISGKKLALISFAFEYYNKI